MKHFNIVLFKNTLGDISVLPLCKRARKIHCRCQVILFFIFPIIQSRVCLSWQKGLDRFFILKKSYLPDLQTNVLSLRGVTPLILLFLSVLSSCSTLLNSPKYQLSSSEYLYRQKGSTYSKADVIVSGDSIAIYNVGARRQGRTNKDQFFLKKSFDVDIITVPAKYRPAAATLPTQLNSEFNGNIFFGYRLDRFKVYNKVTANVSSRKIVHRALTFGGFGGLGSSQITPSTTRQQIVEEYNGLIFQRGIAFMIGVNNLTVGLGIGWDYLNDKNSSMWIYQNKRWYGLTVGLNLN